MGLSGKMYDHALDYLKGWFDGSPVDIEGLLSPNVTVTPVTAGSTVHLNTSGQFELGASGNSIAIFLNQGSDALDVDLVNSNNEWYNVIPAKVMSGLVATNGYILETTEFDQSSGAVFACGDLLHAPTEAQATVNKARDAGKLFKTQAYAGSNSGFTLGTQNICGSVFKDAVYSNQYKRQVVQFVPVWYPGTA